ncbi:leukotriene-A4 hydrolase [Crepidotus variabilis]|uniref:Leukotriene-A4 hydrolase n=1 Tax=Crepidotus variabilis TaxID=179855 RepID=A0A9P6JN84_9AGAR|nr:leukotriene-A4 hydrolase [Crepidotus variabilis]
MADITRDTASQSNPFDVATEHASFIWTVDFELQVIRGSVTHKLTVKKDSVKEVIFDTWDLEIFRIEVNGSNGKYDIKPKKAVVGSALHIFLPSNLKQDDKVTVKIDYSTTGGCTALQWLDKRQTQGKEHPYLFSQCQPTYARALAPLQDTPANKIKYSAAVTSILPVLLSARRVSPPADGPPHNGKAVGKEAVVYKYDQPVPIPTYLIAIASGNMRYKLFSKPEGKSWTSGVWAEPELIEKAFWEFSEDTTRFLSAEEEIIIDYQFGVYDLLVLPPSFPYGGMENACISFLTPSLLTGDRTLVDVVVHELTHSWFGNGVTHANPSHFWLNEGWTTYIERVLQERLHSPAERGFAYVIGSKALYDDLERYCDQPKFQRLVISFQNEEDPDDAYSSVPYEKGANFILHLEQTLGGLDVFLPYVKDYVKTFLGQSITTAQWKDHLYSYWSQHGGPEKVAALDTVDWEGWLYGEGTHLPVKMTYDLSLAEKAYHLAERWHNAAKDGSSAPDFKPSDIQDFNSNQIVVFLEKLHGYKSLDSPLILHLGKIYHIAETQNAEIRLRFYILAFLDPLAPAAKALLIPAIQWLIGEDNTGVIKGRMKFCRPVFRAAARVNRKAVLEAWNQNKGLFHPIAQKLIDKDLEAQVV